MSNISYRITPLLAKLLRKAPFCPWKAALALLNPRTLRVFPPKLSIEIAEKKDGFVRFIFDGKHSFWFPESMPINQELWSEYLVAFWDSPTNFHDYLVPGISIDSGDTVVDCGACEGFFTRCAIENGATRVIAVEPSKEMAKCLRLTFAAEIEAGKVVIEETALGDHAGTANFSETDIFGGHIDTGTGNPVKLSTIDQISADYDSITLIKMDLEGAEYQALLGGKNLLSKKSPKLAITTYHNPWDYVAVSSLIKSLGYKNCSARGVTLRGETVPRAVMCHAY